jgi:hypothetical protein
LMNVIQHYVLMAQEYKLKMLEMNWTVREILKCLL